MRPVISACAQHRAERAGTYVLWGSERTWGRSLGSTAVRRIVTFSPAVWVFHAYAGDAKRADVAVRLATSLGVWRRLSGRVLRCIPLGVYGVWYVISVSRRKLTTHCSPTITRTLLRGLVSLD